MGAAMTSTLVHRGAFLHIPKTGGTWVYQVLQNAGLVKGPIGHEHNYNRGGAKWAFTTVRDPAQWWLSLWRHRMDEQWAPFSGGEAHPLYPLWEVKEEDIEVWIERVSLEYAGFCGRLYSLYVPLADFVLRTEDLPAQLARLAQLVGYPPLDVSFPGSNVSRQPINRSALDVSALYKSEPEAMEIWKRSGIK